MWDLTTDLQTGTRIHPSGKSPRRILHLGELPQDLHALKSPPTPGGQQPAAPRKGGLGDTCSHSPHGGLSARATVAVVSEADEQRQAAPQTGLKSRL